MRGVLDGDSLLQHQRHEDRRRPAGPANDDRAAHQRHAKKLADDRHVVGMAEVAVGPRHHARSARHDDDAKRPAAAERSNRPPLERLGATANTPMAPSASTAGGMDPPRIAPSTTIASRNAASGPRPPSGRTHRRAARRRRAYAVCAFVARGATGASISDRQEDRQRGQAERRCGHRNHCPQFEQWPVAGATMARTQTARERRARRPRPSAPRAVMRRSRGGHG